MASGKGQVSLIPTARTSWEASCGQGAAGWRDTLETCSHTGNPRPAEAVGLTRTHTGSCEHTKSDGHAEPRGLEAGGFFHMLLPYQHLCWGRGPGETPARPVPQEPDSGLRDGWTWGWVPEFPNIRCCRGPGGSDDCVLTHHQYLASVRSCGPEPAFLRCVPPHSPSLLQSARLATSRKIPVPPRVGPSAAGHSGKMAWEMICTMKSPLNHCLNPVPGLLFPA